MPHRANGSYVSNADALTAWTPAAREALLTTAATYHALLSADDLAAHVQEESGIATDQAPGFWIRKLLERVAAEAQRREEPPLAALCVLDTDDDDAAMERLLCYRAYATDLPADGGVPARAPRTTVTVRREPRARAAAPRIREAAIPALREVTCTNCFMIVAVRETCSSCGAPLNV
ncbi:hypothetical protein [Pseudolysinimonas sp.]|jgi:hypothetical protein|uniref:hypothetical protein n=1 Tax=Pseudolysinimonas sp. TaxID=2680009 RepID=UPI003783DD65